MKQNTSPQNLIYISLSKLAFVGKFQIHHHPMILAVDLFSFFNTLDSEVFSWFGWSQSLSLCIECLCSENAMRKKSSFISLQNLVFTLRITIDLYIVKKYFDYIYPH